MSKKDTAFNKLVAMQTVEVQSWVAGMDKRLTDGGCKSAVDDKGNFTYTSRTTGKIVCRINLSESGCTVRPNTNHASGTTDSLPESMKGVMRNARGCGGCAKKNPSFVECKHGGPYRMTDGGESFESCRFVGFNFALDSEEERDALTRWIEAELIGA